MGINLSFQCRYLCIFLLYHCLFYLYDQTVKMLHHVIKTIRNLFNFRRHIIFDRNLDLKIPFFYFSHCLVQLLQLTNIRSEQIIGSQIQQKDASQCDQNQKEDLISYRIFIQRHRMSHINQKSTLFIYFICISVISRIRFYRRFPQFRLLKRSHDPVLTYNSDLRILSGIQDRIQHRFLNTENNRSDGFINIPVINDIPNNLK